MNFPNLTETTRLARLQAPTSKVRVVIDTDTFNEVDDQFAIVHALLSPEQMSIEAIYAAPFHNALSSGPAEGMEKSYDEILRLLEKLNWPDPKFASPAELTTIDQFVYRGSTAFLDVDLRPQKNAAVDDLIRRALASPGEDPLYVIAIGAITNIASAILLEPSIIEKMVVIWLGGHALEWPHTREFNLKQDVPAARLVFDSGVPMVMIPCMGVTSHLHTTIPELEAHVSGRGEIGDYLVDIVKGYNDDHIAWSKQIWDVAATAYMVDARWAPSQLVHSPVLTDQVTWSVDHSRHLIRYVYMINRDKMFRDLFDKLALL